MTKYQCTMCKSLFESGKHVTELSLHMVKHTGKMLMPTEALKLFRVIQ